MKYLNDYLKAHPLQSFMVWFFATVCLNCVLAGVLSFPWSLLVGIPGSIVALKWWPFPDQYEGAKHRKN